MSDKVDVEHYFKIGLSKTLNGLKSSKRNVRENIRNRICREIQELASRYDYMMVGGNQTDKYSCLVELYDEVIEKGDLKASDLKFFESEKRQAAFSRAFCLLEQNERYSSRDFL